MWLNIIAATTRLDFVTELRDTQNGSATHRFVDWVGLGGMGFETISREVIKI